MSSRACARDLSLLFEMTHDHNPFNYKPSSFNLYKCFAFKKTCWLGIIPQAVSALATLRLSTFIFQLSTFPIPHLLLSGNGRRLGVKGVYRRLAWAQVVEVGLVQQVLQFGKCGLACLGLELTFPDDDGVPPHPLQLGATFQVTLAVTLYLLCPKLRVALRQHEVSAILVPMPEASVYEYHRAVLAQHDVGRARQPLHVHPVAESPAMEVSPHRHLRLGVAAMYAGHASVPLLSGQFVGHGVIEFSVKYTIGNGIRENLSANIESWQDESI